MITLDLVVHAIIQNRNHFKKLYNKQIEYTQRRFYQNIYTRRRNKTKKKTTRTHVLLILILHFSLVICRRGFLVDGKGTRF